MEAILGIIIGILIALGIVWYFRTQNTKKITKEQSTILLDKIKTVTKLITVEGDFAEIFQYEDVKAHFLKLITSKKTALVQINAKAHIGYDLRKIKMHANNQRKKIIITEFPQPEILSIETNLNYYDKKDGYLNKFAAADLTEINKKAKQHILDKIPDSGLLQSAQNEALEAITLMQNIVDTIGWKLDYSALEIEHKPSPKLLHSEEE